ncbi:fec operon regulator FecR [compost metagenome]
MTDSRAADMATIREQAADWLLRLEDASPQTLAEFEAWRAADTRHAQVYEQIERMWQALAPQPKRRAQRSVALGLALALPLLLALGQVVPVHPWLADQRSGNGEIRRIELEDGSRLTLNSNSAVNIHYDANERRIELVSGEVLADVRRDPQARPFLISNRDGEVRALGTRYLVRQDASGSRAAVIESKVSVSSTDGSTSAVTLNAGEQVDFDNRHIGPVEPLDAETAAWSRDQLVFRDRPLDEVLAELERHRHGLIWASGDLPGDLRFTGVLPLADSDAALRLLEASLPIRMERHSDYLLRVVPR